MKDSRLQGFQGDDQKVSIRLSLFIIVGGRCRWPVQPYGSFEPRSQRWRRI